MLHQNIYFLAPHTSDMTDFYDYYKDARDAAWKILIKYHIVEFPFSIKDLAMRMNIKLVSYSNSVNFFKEHNITPPRDAFPLYIDGYYIFYDEKIEKRRRRFNIAHELGHIVLDHIPKNTKVYIPTPYQEVTADRFGADLLMPAIVARHNNITTKEEIYKFFGVSNTAAEKREERFEELNDRNKYLTHHLERQYYELYKNNLKQ